MMDLFRHLRIHTQKKPKDGPEEMDFPEMYLMGLGATTELPDKFERRKNTQAIIDCWSSIKWPEDLEIPKLIENVLDWLGQQL